jgi:hypothetical protein
VRGGISGEVKLNDRPTDTFSGEAGDDMSVPGRRTNGTAPGRVACQSLKGETANKKRLRQGKEVFLLMAGQIFMRVDEVAEELGVSKPYAYKLIKRMNEELAQTGCITIAGRIDRKFFHEKFYGTRAETKRKEG